MPIDYSGGGQLKEFGPKVGECKTIHIRDSKRVDDPTATDDNNFRSRTKNFGYRFELTLTNGRLFLLNVWKLFFAFKDAVVEDGDLVQIDHPGEGVYKVTVLEKGTGIGLVVPDLEKEQWEAERRENSGQTAPAPVTQAAPVTQPVVQAPVTQAAPAVTNPAPVVQAPVTKTEEELDLPF